jgi:hypothetical protein
MALVLLGAMAAHSVLVAARRPWPARGRCLVFCGGRADGQTGEGQQSWRGSAADWVRFGARVIRHSLPSMPWMAILRG